MTGFPASLARLVTGLEAPELPAAFAGTTSPTP